MDKRSWPWRKKGTIGSTLAIACEPHAAFLHNPTDESIKVLNERLLTADDLVKQHVKVAEEAVAGWEKSKAENLSLKHRLDQLMEQNKASDDQISILNEALKESTWKLRQIREEQEQAIHDAVVNKTLDWENVRLDLQQKLEDSDHQLVEAEFQNSRLFKRAQEQAEALLQLSQARSNAEAKLEMLQVRLEKFETENASLKYEATMLNNELAIRNQERDINKRSLDVACRQRAESARRITKLEIECQKLRALVRKKLPSPGPLMQMKLEAEGLDDARGKWSQGNQTVASLRSAEPFLKLEGTVSKQLLAMEEETKMLKEVLVERNTELQTARIASAQMTEKLSTLERQQVGQAQKPTRPPFRGYGIHGVDSCVSLSSYKEASHALRSEDGADDERSVADSWASALISELACFSKERVTMFQQPRKSPQSNEVCDQLDSIDDFLEVERLVSLPPEQTALVAYREGEKATVTLETLAAKETELQTSNMNVAELKGKLVLVEDQLGNLSSKNAAHEINLFGLQHKLDLIIANFEEGADSKAIEEVKSAVLDSRCSSVDGPQARLKNFSMFGSEAPSFGGHGSSPNIYGKQSVTSKSELNNVTNEVVRLVEELAHESKAQRKTCNHEGCISELDCKIKQLKLSVKQDLEGNWEMVEVMKAVFSVLNEITMRNQPVVHLCHLEKERHKQEALKSSKQEVLSDTESFSSSKSYGCALPAVKVSPAGHKLSMSRETQADENVPKLHESAALESRMKAELSRTHNVEKILLQVQNEKSQLVSMLEEEKEKLEAAKSQVIDDEQLIANLRVRLASAEHAKHMADENLCEATSGNSKLVSQLQECKAELNKWHEMVKSLERSMDEKREKNNELQAKVEELQGVLERATTEKSSMGIALNAEKALHAEKNVKEEAMMNASEQLAECQRAILVLGKQIQSMTSGGASVSRNSSGCNSQEGALSKERFDKDMEGSSFATTTISRGKQSTDYEPDFSMSELSDDAAENATSHEVYVKEVSQQLASSPESEANTQMVPYVPPKNTRGKKSAARPAASAVDLAKFPSFSSSASSPKRGNSFSRFFTRNKRAPS